ncbi:TRAP transporter large permease [uncultured Aeromicrobium sp.]|uniref:TRAP transporter large permease n=1 Tax=uncultured Aeromicrobium sp. TaxID=337820 RepID=UPI0025EDF37D|nr:TRAP transporter large permease [uncultured Aeromicrobium sp.]
MENGFLVALVLAVLIGLLMAGVSVAISLASSGILGLVLLSGTSITSSVIAGTSYSAVAKSSLIVVPLFILMGMLTLYSGIAEQLFGIAAKVFNKIPGSLAISTVFASAGFSAVCGSSLATVATLGRTCIVEMMRHGYSRAFAAGTVATSGTIAVLIPPSIILVLYGVITGESVGMLLLAGIIPGIVSAGVLALAIMVRVMRHPALVNRDNAVELRELAGETGAAGSGQHAMTATAAADDLDDTASSNVGVVLTARSVTLAVTGLVALFTVVMGGIYTGFFTPSESAAVGALAAFVLICAQHIRRPRQLRSNVGIALRETASLNAMIFLILVGAGIFSYFLVTAGVPAALSDFVLGLDIPPLLTVLILLLVLIPGGMFLDSISLLVITVPLVYQPITDLGFDGIWLGILIVKMIELGMVTPPVGMNAFVTAGTVPHLEPEEVFRGLIPYYFVDVLIIAVLFAIPGITTWLPNLSAA